MPSLDLAALWEAHCRYEFETRDVDATMATGLPVAGVKSAHKVMDKSLPSNELMARWVESEGKPLWLDEE
jgi:hypothetical protein